jgi:hypothetical protein
VSLIYSIGILDLAQVYGTLRYCFGAQCAIKLAVENSVKAIVLNHPAFLELPHDFQVCLTLLDRWILKG